MKDFILHLHFVFRENREKWDPDHVPCKRWRLSLNSRSILERHNKNTTTKPQKSSLIQYHAFLHLQFRMRIRLSTLFIRFNRILIVTMKYEILKNRKITIP